MCDTRRTSDRDEAGSWKLAYNNFKYVKQRETLKTNMEIIVGPGQHSRHSRPIKVLSMGPVKMPQTAHYKRQNKFMQIAGELPIETAPISARDGSAKRASEREAGRGGELVQAWQLTLRRALSINHFNRNLCVVDVVNTNSTR